MDKERREAVRQRLTQVIEEACQRIKRGTSSLRSLAQVDVVDHGEVVETDHAVEATAGLIDIATRQKQDAEEALYALKVGTYGTCRSCSQDIPAMRLEANPLATYCVTCQDALERRHVGLSAQQFAFAILE